MLSAVFSDIHANLEALHAVQAAGARRGVDRWICLGDVVGYGADPSACLDLVVDLACIRIQGNHDAAVAGVQSVEYFSSAARSAIDWTKAQLNHGQVQALRSPALVHAEPQVLFVHGEPGDPAAWHYVYDADDAQAALHLVSERVVFVGHSHVAFISGAPTGFVPGEGRLRLPAEHRCLINVGSVGQPRDGDPRACFAVHDDATDAFELVRVAYDISATQRKIHAAGLPAFLADRLSQGC